MQIKAIYIGTDERYWQKLKQYFLKEYLEHTFTFKEVIPTDSFCAVEAFKLIYNQMPQIVYIDFSKNKIKMMRLAKWLCRNNELRVISLVGLYDHFEYIMEGIGATINLHHIKSAEVQDVIYDAMSLVDVNIAHMPTYIRSAELAEKYFLYQPVRVSYIKNNHFHIETNFYLKLDEIVDVSGHPLEEIMPSCKLYVDKFYEQDLYYNRRFSYDLEFVYSDDSYFSATNEEWKFYKKLKDNPELSTKELSISELKKAEILEEVQKRKTLAEDIILKINSWMDARLHNMDPKKLKIMIIDDSLKALSEIGPEIGSFPYSINFQTILLGENYQIKRSMPHLLMIRVSEKNDRDIIKGIIQKIQTIKEYNPFVFLFNSEKPSDFWQDFLKYPSVMATASELENEQVQKLGQALDKKVHLTEMETKVFLQSSDPSSHLNLMKEVKILGLTESILYFESEIEIPMWTIFLMKKPTRMVLTVVPHKNDSDLSKNPNCYRCLINGVGENEKSEIRRVINRSLEEKDPEDDESDEKKEDS